MLDKNEQVGFLLYDGKKSDLDLSDSEEISNEEFESVWMDSLDSFKEKNRIKYLSGDAVKCLNKSTIIAHIVNNKGKGEGICFVSSEKISCFEEKLSQQF